MPTGGLFKSHATSKRRFCTSRLGSKYSDLNLDTRKTVKPQTPNKEICVYLQ